MSWTDERIDRLKAMWAEGSTASQIAEDLGGVSRNAVIGKAHRLGLEARPSPVKAGEDKDKVKKVAAPKAAASPKTSSAPKSEAPAAAAAAAEVAPGDAPPGPGPKFGPAPQRVQNLTGEVQYRSVGPGGFIRQGPGDTQAPIPPAPAAAVWRPAGSLNSESWSRRRDVFLTL